MRLKLLSAAAIIGLSGAPLQAATFVQTYVDAFGGYPVYFDTRLGTLDSVTLDVNVSSKYRDWQLTVPATTDISRTVSYVIDGIYRFSAPGVRAEIPLTGSGSVNVPLDDYTFPDGRKLGTFTTLASAFASFSPDPSLYFMDPARPFNGPFLSGSDLGHYTTTDTVFTTQAPSKFDRLSGVCNTNGNTTGEDTCGSAAFRLTYNYTPFAAAVPEPSTWAMMLLGFGFAGGAMRYRRRQTKLGVA